MTIGAYPNFGDDQTQPVLDKSLIQPFGIDEETTNKPERTFGEEFDAITQRGSPIRSSIAGVEAFQAFQGIDATPDPAFSWIDEIVGSKYEQYSDSFFYADNRQQFEAVKADLDRQIKNEHIETTSGWGSFFAGGAFNLLTDPTILFPGGSVVKAGRAGYSLGKSAVNVGVASGVAAAASEGILHGSQETRTKQETLMTIGGSTILGGICGADVCIQLFAKDFEKSADRHCLSLTPPTSMKPK